MPAESRTPGSRAAAPGARFKPGIVVTFRDGGENSGLERPAGLRVSAKVWIRDTSGWFELSSRALTPTFIPLLFYDGFFCLVFLLTLVTARMKQGGRQAGVDRAPEVCEHRP